MDAFAIVRSTVDILNFDLELDVPKDEEISYRLLILAMRRAGLNPTDVEVHDIME